MKYSKYFLIIALLGIVTSCSDFLDRTNPNEPDNVTFWVNEDQLENALPPCYEALQKDNGRNCYVGEYYQWTE